MPDVFTTAKRSEVMSRIRGRGNKDTELALAKLFRRHGISGWRRQVRLPLTPALPQRGHRPTGVRRDLGATVPPPRPSPRRGRGIVADFTFRRERVVVFVDGCFWHGCPRHSNLPVHNGEFWRNKLSGNKTRDRRVTRTLRKRGWRVVRIWEHDLARRPEVCLRRIQRLLQAARDGEWGA